MRPAGMEFFLNPEEDIYIQCTRPIGNNQFQSGYINAKLLPASGQVPLGRGSIDGLTTHLDFVLPVGYREFRLDLVDLVASQDVYLAMVVSKDRGQTFLADLVNNDSYDGVAYGVGSSGLVDSVNQTRGLLYLSSLSGTVVTRLRNLAKYPSTFNILICPGDNTTPAYVKTESIHLFSPGGNSANRSSITSCLNEGATVPRVLGRVNYIRILPEGPTVNPPSSGITLVKGSYFLFGII